MIPLADAQARARNIKVLIFDVDGVLTDGTFSFIPQSGRNGVGNQAVQRARRPGNLAGSARRHPYGHHHQAPVAQTVATRARDLKLEFVYQGQAHKRSAAEAIAKAAGITMDEMCYVGDDIVDLPVMRLCGLAIATANARPQVLAAAHWVTPHRGGDGAGRDAIDFLLEAQGSLERVIEQYLNADDPTARSMDIGAGNM